jgi:hypothetical protein
VIMVPFVVQAALAFWARWLRRSRGAPGWIVLVAIAMVGVATVSALLAVRGLYNAFGAAETGHPSSKATLLAQSISETMYGGAFALLLSLLNATWLLGWSLRSPAQPPTASPDGGEGP